MSDFDYSFAANEFVENVEDLNPPISFDVKDPLHDGIFSLLYILILFNSF